MTIMRVAWLSLLVIALSSGVAAAWSHSGAYGSEQLYARVWQP